MSISRRISRWKKAKALYGESSFREVDLVTGTAAFRIDYPKKYFAEGSVAFEGKIYVLTWTNRVAFVYDAATLEQIGTWKYPREGWGLTTDGKQLIASDGTARLYFMDPSMKVQRTVTVRLNDRPISYLNELEYIDGKASVRQDFCKGISFIDLVHAATSSFSVVFLCTILCWFLSHHSQRRR